MLKRYRWQLRLGTVLIAASSLIYLLQIILFHASRDTFFYLLQDIAFIPIQVLLVTLILNQLLNMREKAAMLNKLNMVIGTFFSEAGTALLKTIAATDRNLGALQGELVVTGTWTEERFQELAGRVRLHEYRIECSVEDLSRLKELLVDKRTFLLRLLENPNLLEHETFTELLWAVFHLTEELAVRGNLANLPPADAKHIDGDVQRAYALLIIEWLAYLKHLKQDYPYLFSFAMRTNPFDPSASVVLQ